MIGHRQFLDPPQAKVISFQRRRDHEYHCIRAIRERKHPSWSQHAIEVRVA